MTMLDGVQVSVVLPSRLRVMSITLTRGEAKLVIVINDTSGIGASFFDADGRYDMAEYLPCGGDGGSRDGPSRRFLRDAFGSLMGERWGMSEPGQLLDW